MKSLLLISHSSNLTGGGEDDFFRLLKYLSRKYSIISVFPPGPRLDSYIKYSGLYCIIPDGIFPFEKMNIKKYLYYIYISIKKIKIFYKFIKIYKNEIGIAFVNSSVCLAEIFVLNIFKIPYVLSVKEKIDPFFVRYFIYLYYRNTAKKIIFISNFLQKTFFSMFKFPKSKIIYSAVDNDEYEKIKLKIIKNDEVKKIKTSEYFSIVSIGAIWPQKNQSLLIKSIEYLNPEYKIQMKIIGRVTDKLYFKYLKKIKDKYQTDKCRVNFLGELNKENVIKEIFLSDCVVITSIQEGLSLVLVETLFVNKPLITTKVGIVEEVIEDNINGIILENPKPNILAEKINYLYENEYARKYISSNCKETFRKYFNIDNYLRQHEKFLIED